MKTRAKPLIIIGFDSEWELGPDGTSNIILSYQYAGKSEKGEWSGIVYTKGKKPTDRLKLINLIGKAIEEGRRKNLLPHIWPKTIYAAAHFTRADLPSFRDFKDLKVEFDSVRRTYVTLGRAYKTHYLDGSRNKHELTIHLIDTMLLTPGSASLQNLGDLYNFPKITLPKKYKKSRMGQLLKKDPDLFKKYAIRDAEICALHAWKMAEFGADNFGTEKVPITLGSLAVKHIEKIWANESIASKEVLGKGKACRPTYLYAETFVCCRAIPSPENRPRMEF